MTRRGGEDHFARVRELYAFDESFAVSSPRVSASPSPRRFLSPRPPLSPSPRLALAGFDEAGRGALAGPVTVGCVHFESLGSGLVSCIETSGTPPLEKVTPRKKQDLTPSALLVHLAGVDDSKCLSPARREEMYHRITEVASWGIGWASAQEIDRLGIVPAVSLAARRAYSMMGERVDLLLCDRGLSLLSDLAIERLNHLQPRTPNHPISLSSDLSISQSPDLSIIQSLELSFTKGDSRSLHIAAASILAKVARDRMMLNLHQRFPVYGFAANKGYGTPAHLAALRENGPSSIHRCSFKRVRS
ncbi:ribonuclease HII, partial [Candidatus Bipolaricaulota bacterium]|nr:ribonuclease HII [Candidatus Bipolaricaulota bacterium]